MLNYQSHPIDSQANPDGSALARKRKSTKVWCWKDNRIVLKSANGMLKPPKRALQSMSSSDLNLPWNIKTISGARNRVFIHPILEVKKLFPRRPGGCSSPRGVSEVRAPDIGFNHG